MDIWFEKNIRLKEEKAIVKLYDENNKFIESIIIPTEYYPLNGKYEVFNYKNTKEVKNKDILDVFDSVKYYIGSCYSNTAKMIKILREKGIEAKPYAGWIFTEKSQTPVHHAWIVINNESILDLSDDFTMMLSGENSKNFENLEDKIQAAEMIASFQIAARKVKNSVRCQPVGVPTPFLLYIGCECEPEKAVSIYNNLIRNFPNHECQRNLDSDGYNQTQRIMRDRGIE